VRLDSEPSGVQVYQGPRLLGTTPLDVEYTGDETRDTLTLVHKMHRDLKYRLRAEDGPMLTLRMQGRAARDRSPSGRAQAQAATKPRVEAFDESAAPRAPKVRAIDE
jgi:hypothetical protein